MQKHFLIISMLSVLITAAVNCTAHPADMPEGADKLIADVSTLLVNNKGESIDNPGIQEKDYLLFYWAANWYAPSKSFTKKLIEIYNDLGGGGRFEVIFISLDRSRDDMIAHMQEMEMPWYAIAYDKKPDTNIDHFSGGDIPQRGGIPHLMLTNKQGKILGRGRGRAYAVLFQFSSMLGGSR